MRARLRPDIKAILGDLQGFQSFFGGARWPRIMRGFAALASANHASGADGRDLAAALRWGHRGRGVQYVGHCGLQSGSAHIGRRFPAVATAAPPGQAKIVG